MKAENEAVARHLPLGNKLTMPGCASKLSTFFPSPGPNIALCPNEIPETMDIKPMVAMGLSAGQKS